MTPPSPDTSKKGLYLSELISQNLGNIFLCVVFAIFLIAINAPVHQYFNKHLQSIASAPQCIALESLTSEGKNTTLQTLVNDVLALEREYLVLYKQQPQNNHFFEEDVLPHTIPLSNDAILFQLYSSIGQDDKK